MAEIRVTESRPIDETDRTTAHPQDDEDVLSVARQRFAEAMEAESAERAQQLAALRFRSGEQWDPALKASRSQPGSARPCLVVPRQEQFIRQVTNEQRRFPQSIRVKPVDSGADVETARILQGMVRHIEVASRADIAFATAYDQAVGQGLGYVVLRVEYVDDQSFAQEIKICRVRNRFSVYLDPHSQQPDGLDADWGFLVDRLSRSAFCARYGVAPSTLASWSDTGDTWINATTVQVAEYWYKEYTDVHLVQLADGTVMERAQAPAGAQVVQRRTARVPTVKGCLINGYQILEQTTWLGRYIPLIPVLGTELDVDGTVLRTGMIQPSMDSQRIYNYERSATIEAIALAPKAPFVGYAEVFEGYEPYWATANTQSHAYLPVRQVMTPGGMPLPLPQRMAVEPAIQAMTQASLQAADDIKATLGMYIEGQDPRTAETSGIAIEKRQAAGQASNFNYPANLAWTMRALGIQLVNLLPKIYDAAQVVRIIGEDDETEQVEINTPFRDGQGIERFYQLGVGRYDVTISSGPAYETARQQSAEMTDRFITAYPPAAPVLGDLLMANIDAPNSKEMAQRLKTLVPPEALAATGHDKPEDQLVMLQNTVQKLSQDLKALDQYAQQQEQVVTQAQQQLQLMERALADAKVKLDTKTEELSLKGRELDLDARKIEYDHQEQMLKLDIDTAKLSLNGAQAPPAP